MPIFECSDEICVGNAFVDNDHRQSIGLLNALNDAKAEHKSKDAIGQILDELVAHIKVHFNREESVMLGIRYADFIEHKKEHDKLITHLVELQRKFKADDTVLNAAVFVFLCNWLFQHITQIDKKLAHVIEADKIRTKITTL